MKLIKKLGSELYIGMFFLVLGFIILMVIIPNTIRVMHNPLMVSLEIVQNGRVMPSAYAILIIGCAVAIIIQQVICLKKGLVPELIIPSKEEFKETTLISIGYILITIAFAVLLPIIGFIPTSIICLLALCWLYGYTNIKVIILVCTIIPVGFYFLLTKLLYVKF